MLTLNQTIHNWNSSVMYATEVFIVLKRIGPCAYMYTWLHDNHKGKMKTKVLQKERKVWNIPEPSTKQ